MAKNQAPQTDEVDQLLALNKTSGASAGPSKSGSAVDAFVREVRPIAEAAGRELGVDPSYLIGQWGHETAWGKSVIPGTFNYGNIKDFRGGGVSAKDNMTGSVDKYRAYESPDQFAKDYAQLIRGRRYSSAMGAKDAQSFFSALKAGGYAEDPNYVRSGVRAAEMARNAMGGSASPSLYPTRGEYIGNTDKVMRDAERQAAADESPLSTSVERGIKTVGHNIGLFVDTLADDNEGAAERIKAKREWDEANPAPSSSTKFVEHWQKLAEDDYMGMLGSVLSNPGGMVNQLVEQTPNSLPGLALQIPVAIATTGLMATGWGAPLAMGLQGVASFVGNVLPEGGAIIEERLAKAGINPNDTQAVARWLAENRGANLEAGAKKAGVISAVDGVTGYMAGKLIAGPSVKLMQAEAKAFADAGIDASNKAARDAARATPAYKAAMAQPAQELMAATTAAQKFIRHAGGFAAESVGEGVGEYAGSYAAHGDASVKDAVLESLMGAGTSAAMTGAGSVMGAMKAPDMDRSALEALAATPVQPTIQPNSPLSNMASIGQAAQANAVQAQAAAGIAPQEAQADPIATRLAAMQSFVEDKAFIQALRGTQGYGPESVTEMLSAFAKARNPNLDPMIRERALSDLEGFIQGFNNRPNFVFGQNTQERPQAPGQQVATVPPQGGAVANPAPRDDGRTLNGEIITRPDTMAGANPNQLAAPPVLGLPTEEALAAKRQADADYDQAFQDLVKAEQLGATEAELAEYHRTLAEAERLRSDLAAQIADTDTRVSDAQRREAEARRREILARVIEDGISGVNPVADVSVRFSDELRRQGYRDADPTEAETQSILRAVDVANAREDGPLPSLPNEGDFYEPPKPPRAAAPKAEAQPKQQPVRKLTPLEIRKYIAAGAVLNGDTLTLPDGTTIKIKGPQIAAAREAIRKAAPQQVESVPVEASDSAASEQEAVPQEVETADAASANDPAPEIRNAIDAAAHEAATSPLNDTPQPTDAQKEAGNYKVGKVRVQGMDISIENPKGSKRSGVSPDGTRWESTMASHYGYFTGTKAADGDHLDVFLSEGAEDAPVAWVIDQKSQDGTFDEHKIVLGPRTEEEARAAYLANYEPGWDGLGAISSMPIEAFKAWAYDGEKKRKPLVYVEPEVANEAAEPAPTGLDAAIKILMDRTDGNGSPDGLIGPENADARTAIVAALTGKTPEEVAADPAAKLKTAVAQVERRLYDAAGIQGESIAARRSAFLDWLDGREGQKAGRTLEDDANQEPVKNKTPVSARVFGESSPADQEAIKNAEPAAPLPGVLVDSKPFVKFEMGESAMKVIGDPTAIKERMADAGIKGLPRKDGAAIPQKDAQALARKTIPVRIDTYRVDGVPDRLADVSLEVMESGAVALISPAETSQHKDAATALAKYAESYGDSLKQADELINQEPDQLVETVTQPAIAEEVGDADETAGGDAAAESVQAVDATNAQGPTVEGDRSELIDIFEGLSRRGLARTRAKQAAKAHRLAKEIDYVEENFHDILLTLESRGLVEINCV